MTSPLVSVVTPSYNQRQYIRDTIESVRAQTYPRIEHIVIDGGSDDGTVDVLEEYDDLRWTSRPDDGQADAINQGFAKADGDIVTWLNTDDIYLTTETIETVVTAFDAAVEVIYGDIAFMSADSYINRIYCPPRFDYEKFRQGRHSMPPQPATFFNATVFDGQSLDESLEFVFDYDLWLTIGDEVRTRYVDTPLAGFRLHEASKTVDKREGFRREREQVEARHGVTSNPARSDRASDVILSGIPRRLDAVRKFTQLRASSPDAMAVNDIKFAPVSRAVLNTALGGAG